MHAAAPGADPRIRTRRADRPLTGLHVLAMFACGFGIIVAVNLALAVNAVRTFPGVETASSYVVSQRFQDERAAQLALGWRVAAWPEDGALVLSIRDAAGRPVEPASLTGTLGRATSVRDDMVPAFAFDGTRHVAPAALGPGNWNLRLEAVAADGTPFRQRVIVGAPR